MNERLDFLKKVLPFSKLPDEILWGVAELLTEVKYSKSTVIYHQETTKMKVIDLIVKGEYESFFYDNNQNKRLVEHHPAGTCYGGISVLLNRKRSLRTVIAKKGTLVYTLPRKDFKDLCKAYEEVFQYFMQDFGQRMQNDEFAHFFKHPALFDESYISSEQLYSRKIESVEQRDIICCEQETSITACAKLMAERKLSCLFIEDDQKQIVGYVTDITLRDNVIARGLSASLPVKEIMDNPVVSIKSDTYVYEAILLMFRTKTRYLLIEEAGKYTGFVSRNKLLSEQAQSPLVFIQSVKQAHSAAVLKSKWQKVPFIVSQLLGRGVNTEIINQVITTISDTIAIKVIESVIEEMGTPPAQFAFIVLGSEGRKEQTLKTDQDNAIIYEDKGNEQRELVRDYFLKLADNVSVQLNEIGFSFCTGGYMASNPKWTHSLSHWKRNYEKWMEDPLPEKVIRFSTFFDCRYLYGNAAIVNDLKLYLDEELQKPLDKLFFYMAKNALQFEPPLNFFNQIKTFTVDAKEVFDIKNTMTQIVDIVRLYALKNRIFEVNTGERLKILKERQVLSETMFHELWQSYYYLMSMRLKKQALQIIQDKSEPDNYILEKRLTKIEQATLKEIFKTISKFQNTVKLEFMSTLFG